MDLFRHRPLFLFCATFLGAAALGGCVLFRGTLEAATVLLIALAVLAAFGMVLFLVFFCRGRKKTAVVSVIAFFLAMVALLQSYDTFAGARITRLRAMEGRTTTVTATVVDRRGAGGYLSNFSVSLDSVNGVPTEGVALLTCHYLADLSPGQVVEMEVTLVSLEEAAGDNYDAFALRGDGYVVGLLSETEALTQVVAQRDDLWQVRTGAIRRTLAARLNLLTGKAAGGIPSALLLGDKTALQDAVRRDFSRAGVSHLLAISGLHMTLLFGLLDAILRLLHVPRRFRAVLLSLAALGYLILLGFPPSATRAVIMLGMVYLSTLLSARADTLTSLGLAGALIVAVTPCAVADAGFWMSFLATLGIVSFSPALQAWYINRASKKPCAPWLSRIRARLWKTVCGLLVGLMAMSFTLFVVATVIGEMGVLSPVSTLLLTPLCGAILLLSLVALLLFGTPAGDAVGGWIGMVSEWMTDLASAMAEPSWTVVSLVHPAVVPVAAVMTGSLFVMLALRLPKGRRWTVALPMLVGWLSIGGILAADAYLDAEQLDCTYLQPSSQSDMLVLVEGHEAVICDMSNGSLTAIGAAANEAARRGATEISVLMLTHYHKRTAGTLADMFARETVRALWLPVPADEDDYYCLLAYIEKAEAADVPITLYQPGKAVTVFSDCALTLQTASLKRSVQSVLLLSMHVPYGENAVSDVVLCGSSVFESDLAEVAADLVDHADTVIFGNHGPLPKAAYGADLSFSDRVLVILSAEGDTAGYFDPSTLPGSATLWRGQKRFSCP